MRIRNIGIRQVLHYDSFSLDFGQQPTGLHVVYGPNEAGKSTLLQVILDIMFGGRISDQMKDLYSKTRHQITGVLEKADGEQFYVQRKRNRSTLILENSSGPELSEEQLVELLCGYERDRFMLLFGFDHARLRQGGESLLQSGGHAGVSLFEAGGGVQYLQLVLSELADRSGRLVDPGFARNSAKLLNKAWRAYKEAETNARSAGLRGDKWHDLRRDIEDVTRKITDMSQQQTMQNREASKLHRVLRVRSAIGRLNEFKRQLAELDCSMVLPEDLDTRIIHALSDREDAEKALRDLSFELQQRRSDAEAIHVNIELLAEDEAVRNLSEQLAKYEAFKLQDIPRLKNEIHTHKGNSEELLNSLAPVVKLEAVEQLRIPFTVEERIQQFSEKLKEVRGASTTWQERVDEQVALLEKIQAELALKGELRDISSLRAIVQQVRKEGNLDESLRMADRALEEQRRVLAGLLRMQTVWQGTVDELAKLPVPLRETIDQFARAWESASRNLETSEADLERANEELANILEEITALDESGHVPDEEELAHVRHHRDKGWHLVKQVWLERKENNESIQAYSGDYSLVEAYEVAVEEADKISDWMWRDSKRVAQRAELLRQKEQREQTVQNCEAKAQDCRQQFTHLSSQWDDAWSQSGIKPLSPSEMKEWLSEYWRPVREGSQKLQSIEQERDIVQACRDDYIALMEAELVRLQVSVQPRPVDVNAWVRLCELCIGKEDGREFVKQELEKRLNEADEKLAEIKRKHRQAEEQLTDVIDQWAVLRTVHPSLPEDADIATKYVSQVRQLFEHIGYLNRSQQELTTKEVVCAEFELQSKQLAERLNTEALFETSCEGWVRNIAGQLNEAREQLARREQIQKDIGTLNEKIGQKKAESQRLKTELDVWMSRYGCTDYEALWGLVEKSQRHKVLEQKRSEEEGAIRDSGDGLDVAILENEAEKAGGPDTIKSRLEAIEAEIDELKQQIETENRALWSLQKQFEALDGTQADSAEMAQLAEHHMAEVDEYWNEYVRIELGRRLLQRAIEEFRQQNEFRVLETASAFFKQLTRGRYSELMVEYDVHNEPYLVAKNRDANMFRVHQMSDGTRDQLFLSLRLAFVEQHLKTSEPLPLIMDDILVHFDDERAQATLEVLRTLADRTQVIYFTHQRSVLAAALRLIDSGVVTCQDLSSHKDAQESESTA